MSEEKRIEEIVLNTKYYNTQNYWDKKIYTCWTSEHHGTFIEYDYRNKEWNFFKYK